MKHDQKREELFVRFVSGELDGEELHQVEELLAGSAELRRELENLQYQRVRLQEAVGALPVPPSLRTRLQPTTSRQTFSHTPGVWRGLQLAGALAMVLLLLVTAWQFFRPATYGLEDLPASVAAVFQIGAGKHVSCVKERINAPTYPLGTFSSNMSEEYRILLENAQQALPPDYTLVERHLCGNAERRFAHLVLAKDGVYLSVMITRRDENDPNLPHSKFAVARVGDVSVYAVRHDGMDIGVFALPGQFAFVISDPSQRESLHLSRSVAEALSRQQ
jgi:hypothetical protein